MSRSKVLVSLAAAALLVPSVSRAEPVLGVLPDHDPVEVDLRVDAADPLTAAQIVLGMRPELRLVSVKESLAGTHVRFQIIAPDGSPVVDRGAAVHFVGQAPHLTARLVEDALSSDLIMVGRRVLDENAAAARAVALVGAGQAQPAEAIAIPVGPSVVRPGYRVIVVAPGPHQWEVWVDADSSAAEVRRDRVWRATGMVYKPNPMTLSGDTTLADNGGADSATLTSLRESATLLGLASDTGPLTGDYADAHRQFRVVTSAPYDFTRSNPGFIEVNAYYHIDHAQRNLQRLGYTGAKAILARRFEVIVDALGSDDQSVYQNGHIEMGLGGVPDAEDGDIIGHEYGHAVQDAVISGFGTTADSGALGEGFGDIQAYSIPTDSAHATVVPRECIGAWDARGYGPPPADCLRRVDGNKHPPEELSPSREVHDDGEIWSGALHDLGKQSPLGVDGVYQLVLESTFLYTPGESFEAAANALITADTGLHGGANGALIRKVMTWHGLITTKSPAAVGTEVLRSETENLSVGPLANNADVSNTINVPGAYALRVHFASITMEGRASCPDMFCDAIYLYDKAGLLYARMGGTKTDVVGPIIPGDTVVVRAVTNPTGVSAGFVIDKVDVILDPTGDGGPGANGPSGGCGCRVGSESRTGGLAAASVLGLVLLGGTARRRRRR